MMIVEVRIWRTEAWSLVHGYSDDEVFEAACMRPVGFGAGILGYQGYNCSLDYARERPQGRLPSDKNPESKQVPIIEHADVKRMLLAQKAYSEGSVALCLYASHLFEDSKTAATEELRQDAFLLLDLITPDSQILPLQVRLLANELAIQVLGGSGYIREYPVEQYYRDNRLSYSQRVNPAYSCDRRQSSGSRALIF